MNIPGHVKFNSALNKENPSNYKRPTLTLSDTAVLQYTGGTTGVSKGAELTHRNLVANLLQCDGIFQSKFGANDGAKGDRIVCALPLYHIFAFMVCAMYGMYKGQANILIPNPRDLPAVIKELRKYQPSFFPAVNTLFNALVNNEEFKQLDHSNLKWLWAVVWQCCHLQQKLGRKLRVQPLLKVMAYQKLHQLQLRIHLHLLNLVAPLVFHYR